MIINICFHGIGVPAAEREPGESKYWVTEPVFLGILDEVLRHQHVQLSFDDGNKSDITQALPALQERSLRAAFFALAGRLDDPLSLDPSDLREIRRAGMDVGSHGWAHVPWRHLSPRDAEREMVQARDVLAEASGGTVDTAALPLGRYDRATLRQLRGLGYARIYSSDRMPAGSNSWLQARYSVTALDSVETVTALMRHTWGATDLRGLLSSMVKRLR